MLSDYSLPHRQARICRLASAAFVGCALLLGLSIMLSGIVPGLRVLCGDAGCDWSVHPALLLDDAVMAKVQGAPVVERAFTAFALRPIVRAAIVGITFIDLAPLAFMLLGIGVALRRLGGGGEDALGRALPLLRRASQASMIWAVARPLSDTLMNSLLSIGTPDGAQWQICFDLLDVGTALMLGIATFAMVWALEAGLRAQRDFAEIV